MNPSPLKTERPLKYTLCVTQRCNLACSYCYMAHSEATMSIDTAAKIISFLFQHAGSSRDIEVGFFGGEPLIEFSLIQQIMEMVVRHPAFAPNRVGFTITTNGTIFSDRIARFFAEHAFKVCISCDGPPYVQDVFRRTKEGQSCAAKVECILKGVMRVLPEVVVNAVYHPQTLRHLPDTVDYLSKLGARHIYLNPDFSALWTAEDAALLPEIYGSIGNWYCAKYQMGDPHFVSLIDSKIAVLFRKGYHACEQCLMGTGELAFSSDGGIYPCERLIGTGTGDDHRLGDVDHGVDLSRLSRRTAAGGEINAECRSCGLKKYCMTWCGCSNVFMTGWYNRVGPFLCASEKTAITVAQRVAEDLDRTLGPVFMHHLSGTPQWNSRATAARDLRSKTDAAIAGQ